VTTDCLNCPLRRNPAFLDFTETELAFMRRFKAGELTVAPRTTILLQGAASPQIFTTLSGWGVRYKILPDGERQVIGFVLPGDLIGLQAGLLGEMKHSVDSVTDMTLCVFSRADLWSLFKTCPERGYDLTWLAAREEHFLGDMLATIGQRSGVERVEIGVATGSVARRLAALSRGSRVPLRSGPSACGTWPRASRGSRRAPGRAGCSSPGRPEHTAARRNDRRTRCNARGRSGRSRAPSRLPGSGTRARTHRS